jgi:hypothetical protein
MIRTIVVRTKAFRTKVVAAKFEIETGIRAI